MDPPDHLAAYPCPLCGADNYRPRGTIQGFRLVECRACSMLYVNPRLANSALFELYRANYFHRLNGARAGYENYELSAPLRIRTFERWFRHLAAHARLRPGHALDVGCAAGYFLDILKHEGFEPEGIELDAAMRAAVRQRGYVVHGEPLEMFTAEHPYTLITLFDVLEHLPEVRADLSKLAGILAEGGVLAFATPNLGSFQRRLFGRRWFQFKPLEHIHYFSPRTIRRLLDACGLELVHLARCGQYADFGFLHDRLRRYGHHRLDRLFVALMRLARLENRAWYADTGSMFVICRKRP